MYQQLRLEPYAVHTTFQYAGTEGKRHRLREAMVFYDPPEYYDAPGNYMPYMWMISANCTEEFNFFVKISLICIFALIVANWRHIVHEKLCQTDGAQHGILASTFG